MVLREEKKIELQGGMSNELYNTIARVTDGIYEGTVEVYFSVFLNGSFELYCNALFCYRNCHWWRCFPRLHTF